MKKLLCVILTLALVLAAMAGCTRQYDPQMKAETSGSGDDQSQPESSQPAPEPVTPKPIMPVPSSEPDPEPEPEPEPEEDPAPEEDEGSDEDDEDSEDEDGEDEDDEDGEEQDPNVLSVPNVPHGEDLSWLKLNSVTVEELKPVLDQVLARAEYFCQYGLAGKFTAAGIDARSEVAIKRPYKSNNEWVFYPYTKLPFQTVDELEEAILTAFTWNARNTELDYIFNILRDDGEKLFYADKVIGFTKTRNWNTGKMTIREASAGALTLRMPVTWEGDTFDADLTLQLSDGYLVLDANYFAITDETRARRESH